MEDVWASEIAVKPEADAFFLEPEQVGGSFGHGLQSVAAHLEKRWALEA